MERQESWTTSLDGNRVGGVPLVGGTGWRHKVLRWEESQLTNKHKLVIPAACANKKFVLVVGDSHLRALVDGFVLMPEGPLSFGFMCTPGATAAHLRTELVAAVVPRQPEAVIILAPSNNLTAGRGLENSSADFAPAQDCTQPLVQRKCGFMVVVLDFPPRLSVEEDQQKLLRMAYHSAVRTRTHLSDSGVCLSSRTFWQVLTGSLQNQSQSHRGADSHLPVSSPVCHPGGSEGNEPQPRQQPTQMAGLQCAVCLKLSWRHWTSRSQKKVELRECFIPLTPVRFSPATLRAIEKTSPSFLPSPEEGTAVPVHPEAKGGSEAQDCCCEEKAAKRTGGHSGVSCGGLSCGKTSHCSACRRQGGHNNVRCGGVFRGNTYQCSFYACGG
ncbi:hypothetical protein D5F01_LYC24006 [Larimichthys crocea]|uniref:Uncharacterized protein n=1 Tax=Larimichthys crocea TaxID=215358 RepID=A0A6G0HFZ6_LARCR|nr:hypothetical protein D5F01_LYC24006 [Larimichthys crocea]